MKLQLKRLVQGLLIGVALGSLVWLVVTRIGVWQGITTPAIVGAGTGVLLQLLWWLIPHPTEAGRYLLAFWEVWKMPPSDRILFQQLALLLAEQRQKPHEHIYLAKEEVDLLGGVGRSETTVRVVFWLVSCLLEETPIEICEVDLVCSSYSAPHPVVIQGITNLLKLSDRNSESRDISVVDSKMLDFVKKARSGDESFKFHIEVYLKVNGRREKVKRLTH